MRMGHGGPGKLVAYCNDPQPQNSPTWAKSPPRTPRSVSTKCRMWAYGPCGRLLTLAHPKHCRAQVLKSSTWESANTSLRLGYA